ncbi:MAG: GntR family transcriptional regulator [Anaerolineae bacterium]|nr:GntR family transcriptional regulator [Anaerolineae bacterium]
MDLLREMILSGELAPGDRLRQDELAARFDVSSTPICEAIQQMVAEGVLSHSPYHGVQIAEITLEDIREIYFIRSAVKELATRTAVPNLRITDVKHLHEYKAAIRQSVEAADFQTLRKLNYEFHWLIYYTAGMQHLSQIIRGLWLKSPWDRLHGMPNRPEEAIIEHERLLKAVYARDAQLSRSWMHEHIEHSAHTLSEYLTERPL